MFIDFYVISMLEMERNTLKRPWISGEHEQNRLSPVPTSIEEETWTNTAAIKTCFGCVSLRGKERVELTDNISG